MSSFEIVYNDENKHHWELCMCIDKTIDISSCSISTIYPRGTITEIENVSPSMWEIF